MLNAMQCECNEILHGYKSVCKLTIQAMSKCTFDVQEQMSFDGVNQLATEELLNQYIESRYGFPFFEHLVQEGGLPAHQGLQQPRLVACSC